MDVSLLSQTSVASYANRLWAELNTTYEQIGSSTENVSRAYTVSISEEALAQSVSYGNSVSEIEKAATSTDSVLSTEEKKLLFNSFFDIQGKASFQLKRMLVNLPEEDRNKLLELSSIVGESIEDLLNVLDSLSQEDRSLFLSVGVKSQEGIDDLIHVAKDLEGEALTGFLSFADSLEEETLPGFLEAADAVGGKLSNLIKMGNQVPEEYQMSLFVAAANAKDESGTFFTMLESMLSGNTETSDSDVLNFLNMTANTEGDVSDVFLLVEKTMDDLLPSDFMTSGAHLQGEDLARYISYGLNNYDKPVSLSDFTNLTRQLSGENLSNYLKIAERADGGMEKINLQITQMLAGHAEDSPKILSDYLQVAAKAGNRTKAFTDMVSQLNVEDRKEVLNIISGYNEPDVQNFVAGVADENGDDILKLAMVADTLSAQEKSWLLFALGDHNHDGQSQTIESIFQGLEINDSEERKEYLRMLANAESGSEQDDWVHLRSGFSSLEITYIDEINKNQSLEDLDTLMGQIENLDGKDRLNYLRTAAYAEETLPEFMDMFEQFSEKEKSLFLEASEMFSNKDLSTFIRASENAKEDYEGFVSVLNEVHDREPIHLIRAVSNAGERTEDLLALVDSLSGANRQAFLLAAAYSGELVGGLVDLGNQFIENERALFDKAADKAGNDINDMFTQVSSPIKKYNTEEVLTDIKSLSLIGTQPPQAFSDLFMAAFRSGDHLKEFLDAYLS